MKIAIGVFHNEHRLLAAFDVRYCNEQRLPVLFRYIPELQSVSYRVVSYESGWPLPVDGRIGDYRVSDNGTEVVNAETPSTPDSIAVSEALTRRIVRVLDATRRLEVAYRRYIGGPLVQTIDGRVDLHIAYALAGRAEPLTQSICTAAGARSMEASSLNALRRAMEDNAAQDQHQFDVALLAFIQEIAA